jgi:AraC-like DNA-binding protein
MLAKVASLSRSGFALNFKKLVGIPPMDYLTHWRIQIACELLQTREQSISEVANAVGYESESAFSVAFNRIVKCRPGAYQKQSGNE